jgi:hypothetical protein
MKTQKPTIHGERNRTAVTYRLRVARRAAGLLAGRGRRPVDAVRVWAIPAPYCAAAIASSICRATWASPA